MGNLIIKKVKYSGEKYYFESPDFEEGINIIEGDNGSGKSTLSYFIEFGLGGKIKYFERDPKVKYEKYEEIINDKNNYVELEIIINNILYILKRFIDKNDIFITFPNGKVKMYCVYRQSCKVEVFSDWLLLKLGIEKFELNLGESSFVFGFMDLFRLLNYDQDTEPRKIYKSPALGENFVNDSLIIRKSIFETLMGSISDDYFSKKNKLNEIELKRKEAKYLLDEFTKVNPKLDSDLKTVKHSKKSLEEQIGKLIETKETYQKSSIKIDDKFKQIEEKKSELIKLEIFDSRSKINMENLKIEKNRINKLLNLQKDEIESIEKTITTHEQLNLFDFELCPFCTTPLKKDIEKKCICGSPIKEEDYEKFLYNVDEYQEILKYKMKSLETIQNVYDSYSSKIEELQFEIEKSNEEISRLNIFIREAIKSIEYSGNSKLIEDVENKIIKVKDEIFQYKKLVELYTLKEKYEANFNTKDTEYISTKNEFYIFKNKYDKSNENFIIKFNEIYNKLMSKSTAKTTSAYIDDEYIPYIDGGKYREKSAVVPKRMMYYFTLISMALKFKTIKHPKFLLMDTPEEAGIDDITENIKLFNLALELSKNTPEDKIGKFQFILTTGHNNRCPKDYEQFIKLRFRKEDNNFILKEKK